MVRELNNDKWLVIPVGTVIGFETLVAGRSVVRSWTRREADPSRSLHRLRAWQEVDFSALHRPGGRVRAIFDIDCRDDLSPRVVTIQSSAGMAHIQVTGGRATARLANGSRLMIEGGPWRLALPDNVPALVAMYLRLIAAGHGFPFSGKTLLIGTLQTINYAVTHEGTVLKSNLGERFALDPDGWLSSITQAVDGPEVARRIEPKLPRWQGLGISARDTDVKAAPPPVPSVREIDVSTRFDGLTLWGRWLRPDGRARAAALLIGGSGTHDRFGRAGPVDLGYRDIALGLVRHGIAVLQVDKPGAGRTRTDPSFTCPRFRRAIAMARAWADRLVALAGRDQPIFLIGHSEGGQVAVALAHDGVAVAGVCLIATGYGDIDHVLAAQLKKDADDLGLDATETEQRLHDTRAFFDWVRANRATSDLPDRFKPLAHLGPWYRDLLETTPEQLLPRINVPLMVLHGTADIQVALADAAAIARQARAGTQDVTLRVFEGLDHLMKRTLPTTNIARYGDRRRRVPKAVVDAIADWIAARCPSMPITCIAPQKDETDHQSRRDGNKRTVGAGKQTKK